jgi:transposase
MARKRLTMKKIKEVIRLKYEAGLSNRAIAGACKISNSTVGDYLRRAAHAGLSWPLGELGDEELTQKLYPEGQTNQSEPEYPMPDWGKMNTEKRQKGVTLRLLWQEYKEQHPDGYQYSQFCEHYQRWKKQQVEPSMHKEHKGGEEMEVDYAGLKMQMIDPETGEIVKISVFVATLPASHYLYCKKRGKANTLNGRSRTP